MSNGYFHFKQFTIYQDRCAMKVGTDGCMLGAWAGEGRPRRILDIGTGTGLLALMLAQRFPKAEIDAVEMDTDAAAQARENAAGSPFHDRIIVYCDTVQHFTEFATHQYDLIVSNPPYYPDHLKSPDARRNMALHNETLTFEELVAVVYELLAPQGRFALILPPAQMVRFRLVAEALGLHIVSLCHVQNKPSSGIFREMAVFARAEVLQQEETLVIRDDSRAYTLAFARLMAPFYL